MTIYNVILQDREDGDITVFSFATEKQSREFYNSVRHKRSYNIYEEESELEISEDELRAELGLITKH